MNLEQMLERMEGRQIEAALRFWEPNRNDWGTVPRERNERLRELMTERTRVEARLAELPSRLRELLVHLVKSVNWQTPFLASELDHAELPVESFELDAAIAALVERGFIAVARGRIDGHGPEPQICLAEELGRLIGVVVGESRRPIEAAVGMRLFFRFGDAEVNERRLRAHGHDELIGLANRKITEGLTQGESRNRIEGLEDESLKEILPALIDAGGILDGEGRRRAGVDEEDVNLASWGEQLEEALLGCYHEPDLADHGISVRDGWIILFEEVIADLYRERSVDADEAEADLQRAPDALGDLRQLARELENSPFKVKKNGEYYKASLKKLAKAALTPGCRPLGSEADVVNLLGFLRRSELVAHDPDGTLKLTSKWRTWDKKDAVERLRDLLNHAIGGVPRDMSIVHLRALRKGVLGRLKLLGVGEWITMERPLIEMRNRYLRDAVRPEHARQYQEKHKHAPFPPLASPHMMIKSLKAWLLEGPVRYGLVEVAQRDDDDRPWAMRLTPLGGAALGLKVDIQDETASGCIVNPDHEIIVFPEHAGFDFVQEVARFAVRMKADYAIHFSLTKESVQMGAATGLAAEEILETLASHTPHEIPQNVVFSVEEWCRKVVRIDSRRTWLLEAPDKAALDKMLTVPQLKAVGHRRLSDTVLELDQDPSQSGVVTPLREHGFYL